MKKCPRCGMPVANMALRCPKCKTSFDEAPVAYSYPPQSVNNNGVIVRDANFERIMQISQGIIPPGEAVHVALKGAFKEYLICTDSMVYIIKQGFMTGHTFGAGDFKMPYKNITNAEVDMHLLTGYFELSTGGLQNKRMSYWSSDKNLDPAKQPNVISLNDRNMANLFRQASSYIMERVRSSEANATTNNSLSAADELRKFKALLDDGIITEADFQAKKRQLLNL